MREEKYIEDIIKSRVKKIDPWEEHLKKILKHETRQQGKSRVINEYRSYYADSYHTTSSYWNS